MSEDNLNHLSDGIRQIESQFKEKVEPFRSDLWRYCYRLTGSPWDAEDLVQDTMLKSLSILAKLYQPVKTKSYLFRIATNLWIDQLRKGNGRFTLSNYELLIEDKTTQNDFLVMENLELLIQQLTPIQYVSLLLADVFLFKGKEIAEILNSSESAVHTNLSRARSTLKQKEKGTIKERSSYIRELKPSETFKVMLKGLRNKDPNLIISVLDDNIVTDITHSSLEIGLEELKKNSLRDWKEVVDNQNVIVPHYIELWGRPVIVELEKKEDAQLYLNNIYFLEASNTKITYWKYYCFSWDLMNYAAAELNVKLNAKYFYHIF
ncbi:RNA polymerase sigma factor [Psychrobacillus sp. FSL K6-2836]|uniref:RNA polymerase sigma factor n=1 Tax=Psychrobacillus sp. FSL K6-2836 TaxID=2921548 RepID=UPI0030F644C3